MNWILIAAGSWIVFDGFVSATYFAIKIDHSFKNLQDQAVRIVRTIAGIAVIAVGVVS